ncbi:MAG: hypothetical protein WCF18_13150 [Chthoniobacteraceae bacterium]
MNPRFVCFILAVSISSLTSIRAEETPPAAKAPDYVLKNKSAFTAVTDEQRAPFWPIGWVKRRPMQIASTPTRVVEAPKVVLDAKSFKLTSILLGEPSLAIINGRTYSEGEYLRAPKTAAIAGTPAPQRTRVFRINDGHVVLQNGEQLITLPLLRPELVQRANVEELLSEERP